MVFQLHSPPGRTLGWPCSILLCSNALLLLRIVCYALVVPFYLLSFAYHVAVPQLFMNNYFYKSYMLFRMFVLPAFAPIHLLCTIIIIMVELE